jgi:nucleotide-binding universal stress UspA family protein
MNTMHEPTVVVGFDGSSTACGALRFAAEEAVRRDHPLRIVSVREHRHPDIEEYRADELLAIAAEMVRPLIAPGRTALAAPLGPAVGALLAESDHADVLVLGRGHPRMSDALFGSVAASVVPGARCPVIVVGDSDGRHPHSGPVVVGLDLDQVSTEALEEAFVEAGLRSRELLILCARPQSMRGQYTLPLGLIAEVEDPETDAFLQATVAPLQERHRDVAVTIVHRPGSARHELLEVASAASLIVVGARHRSPAARLLLGSVGRSLVRHADCPVMVAHPRLSHLARRWSGAATREAVSA